ncbi:MAG: helix-turn-helix domain-containing protein [Actinomycetota bacterium]|nr:helix-turn-helix domain-containing protein [Actinomycetota bacterium]
MLTVPEAARRVGRNPETIRRWIRTGRLHSTRVGTQHLIDQADLDAVVGDEHEELPSPPYLQRTTDGTPIPNVVRWVHLSREGH